MDDHAPKFNSASSLSDDQKALLLPFVRILATQAADRDFKAQCDQEKETCSAKTE